MYEPASKRQTYVCFLLPVLTRLSSGSNGANVVNLSLGANVYSASEEAIIKALAAAGVLVVGTLLARVNAPCFWLLLMFLFCSCFGQ
jgi:hypothetical protein